MREGLAGGVYVPGALHSATHAQPWSWRHLASLCRSPHRILHLSAGAAQAPGDTHLQTAARARHVQEIFKATSEHRGEHLMFNRRQAWGSVMQLGEASRTEQVVELL